MACPSPSPTWVPQRSTYVSGGKGWRQAILRFWEVIPVLFSLTYITMLKTWHWGWLIFIYCNAFQNIFETINEQEYNLGNVTQYWVRNLNSVIHLLSLGWDIRSSESSFIHKNQMGCLDSIKNCWRVWLFLNAKGKTGPIRICKSTSMHYQFIKGFRVVS